MPCKTLGFDGAGATKQMAAGFSGWTGGLAFTRSALTIPTELPSLDERLRAPAFADLRAGRFFAPSGLAAPRSR